MMKGLIVLLLLVTCLCLTFTACQKKAEEVTPPAQEEAVPAPAPGAAAPPAEAPAPPAQ